MARGQEQPLIIQKDPYWYKDAVLYELHVRAFADSNADGIGDFPGLTQKLDYLQDLGVTAVWLLPFYPSPLKDDGYDIADYYTINPMYGTLGDFKTFLREAHKRGLRVITELVVNHTSDQHPWFQKSRRAKPGSPWRDYYVWSDTPEKYKEARIIFKDFEPSNWAWDPIAQAYYWHRFYSHQPDLNYDNPQVLKEVTKVLDFWMDMGVDGVRLDAIPYLYEREGTSCENLPETHGVLKELRKHIDAKYGDRMLLGEANQWPEDSVAYFGSGKGDECHMAFHFPVMPRLFMAVRMEDRVPIVDIMEQTPAIPETSQWAMFLRNHDELTLEMVTDEERDYMYRVYAHDTRARINLGIRRRLAPLLGNDRKRIELLHLLLFSLPGTPVLYYGDEIGMGDNTFLGDRNGVRTPMQWSSDRNAGFSRATPQALFLPLITDSEYHYETVNVEAQQRNPHSLLWWTKRLLALRKRCRAFGQGTLEFLHPENRKILAFIRRFEEQTMLVVANLSRFPQPVELDLSAYRDLVPVELFGRTEFPYVTQKPYFLTLSPHAAFWFSLEPRYTPEVTGAASEMPTLEVQHEWEEIFSGKKREKLESILQEYLPQRRWFGAKGREVKNIRIREQIPLPFDGQVAVILILAVDFVEGEPEEYFLPLSVAREKFAEKLQHSAPLTIISRIKIGEEQALLHDAIANRYFCEALFDLIQKRKSVHGIQGDLEGATTPELRNIVGGEGKLEATPARAEQSNTSVVFGDKLICKFFRKLEPGENPDLEVSRFLTSKNFPHIPKVAGWLEFRPEGSEPLTMGILSSLVPNSNDTWPTTLDMLGRYFERLRTEEALPQGPPRVSLLELAAHPPPDNVSALIGTYLELAHLLGQRTAEMHAALGSDFEDKRFTPEPYTPFYQRALYQSMRNLATQNLQLLRRRAKTLTEENRLVVDQVLSATDQILATFRAVHSKPITAMRIRCHGDYHLGQVLYTGKDFVIIDFEGEPARPLGERRIKRSPLRDVAGMIRSFDYATHAAFFQQLERGNVQPDHLSRFEPWARFWHRWVSAAFLRGYLPVIRQTNLLPLANEDLRILLDAHLLEKAIYEVGYELNNRPTWVKIPLQGILQLLPALPAK